MDLRDTPYASCTIRPVHSDIPQRPQRDLLIPSGGIEHHIADMTATFAGDVTLREAQDKLAEAGQWLPMDGDESATLASLVEGNSTGPLRLGFGGWRDNLLGVQFHNGRDELITAGGRVLKNVAGYDFTRFMVGQYGVFGKIVALTTRTYVRPAMSILAAFEPVRDALNAMLVTSCRPHWCVLTPEALLMGYLGDARTIQFYAQALKAYSPEEILTHTLADDIAARGHLWNPTPGQDHIRAMVPPANIGKFVEQAGIKNWVADAAFGIVKASGTFDEPALRMIAEKLGGSVIVHDATHQPKDLKLDPAVRSVLEKLKYAFDPDQRLNSLRV